MGGAGDEAIKAWSQLAANADYRESPLAAEAAQRLVAMIAKEGDPAAVLAHYERLGLDWRSSDDEAAKKAIQAIVKQHVRTEPDEAKLREFYRKIEKDAPEELETSVEYWTWVGQCVVDNGSFGYYERDGKKVYYDLWLGVLQDKFLDAEDY